MINFLKFFQKTEEQKTSEFFKKYRKLSKKYNRDFIAVLSIFKDGKELSGDNEIKEVENLNNLLQREKIGILPSIKIIDTKNIKK